MIRRDEEFKKYINTEIGDYHVKKLLGIGGMGAVFLAHNRMMDVKVALKMLLPEYTKDTVFVERFFREARSAFKLKHENIAQVFHAGHDKNHDVIYLVMELIVGTSIGNILKTQDKFGVTESVKIISQSLKGLEVAHNNHIVHRDIKPDNILINREGAVKIADFGLARGNTSKDDLTMTGQLFGTPSFMSLEQWEGEKLDKRTDIYSLGATFYNILTGEHPFKPEENSNFRSIYIKLLNGDLKLPSEINSDVDEGLEKIIMKMLARDLNERYQDCKDVLYDLEKWRQDDSDYDLSTLLTIHNMKIKNSDKSSVRHSDSPIPQGFARESQVDGNTSIQLTFKKAAFLSVLLVILGIAIAFGIITYWGTEKEDPGTIIAKDKTNEEKPKSTDENLNGNTDSKDPADNEVNPDDDNTTEEYSDDDTENNNDDDLEETNIDEIKYKKALESLRNGNPEEIEEYIDNGGSHLEEARDELKKSDDKIFADASSIEDFQAYIRQFKNPLHKPEAENSIKQLKLDAEYANLEAELTKIINDKDLEKLKTFIEKYPKEQKQDLLSKANESYHELSWYEIEESIDEAKLNAFIEEFQNSSHIDEIQLRLDYLKAVRTKDVSKIKEIINKLDKKHFMYPIVVEKYKQLRWDETENSLDLSALRGFIQEFPSSDKIKIITQKINQIENNLISEARKTNDSSKWRNYIKLFPQGKAFVEAILKIVYPGGYEEPNKPDKIEGYDGFSKNENYWCTTRLIDNAKMVYIPGGRVYLGEINGEKKFVEIKPFLIDCYEISKAQYKYIMTKDAEIDAEEDVKPMTNISFGEAQAYAKKVGAQLPTEAEFMYAAIGSSERHTTYNELENLIIDRKEPVSVTYTTKDKSIFGVCGLGGNVREWCRDSYSENWIEILTKRQESLLFDDQLLANLKRLNDFKSPRLFFSNMDTYISSGKQNVVRGASYLTKKSDKNANYLLSQRQSLDSEERAVDIGFRTIVYIK